MRQKQKLGNAKALRKRMTEAETKLWHQLRAHRFQAVKFKRQCPIGRYVADFVAIQYKLIIEVDGSQHASHTQYDKERDAFFAKQGYTVLRFWNHEVLTQTDAVMEEILKHLSPLPNPLPQAGEGTAKRVAPVAVLLVLCVSFAAPALACSCAKVSRDEVVKNSDVVFTGTVEKVERAGFWSVATLKVHDVEKGTVDEEATVQTASDGAACGVNFEVGQKVEIAAIQRKDRLHTSLCSQMGLK